MSEKLDADWTDDRGQITAQGIRQFRRLIERKDWEMPSEVFAWIPQKLFDYLQAEFKPGLGTSKQRLVFNAIDILIKMQKMNHDAVQANVRMSMPTLIAHQTVQTMQPPTEDGQVQPIAPAGFIEQASLEELAESAAVLSEYGLLDSVIEGSAKEKEDEA